MAGQKRIKPNDESPRHFEYYQTRHPEWSIKECEDACKFFKRSQNYQCIEFYQTHYPNLSNEEQQKLLNERVSKKNSPQKIEYWRNKFPNESEEQIQERYSLWQRQHNYQCIEYWERKFPKLTHEEHLIMLNEKIKNAAQIISQKVSGELNGMHSSKTTDLERKQISPKCIEFYQLRYPNLSDNEHLELLNKQIEKTKKSLTPDKYTTNIEYYLSKGMSYDDAVEALKNRQRTFTLEKCIEKYGSELGTKIYKDRQTNWVLKLNQTFTDNGDGRSKQSKFALNIINECCLALKIKQPKREKYMTHIDGHRFAYDFTYNHKIIEFQGDYWHCNPRLYDNDFFNKVKRQTAQEIWDYDKLKLECANNHGYSVLYIWEFDYNENPAREIQKCIEFLKND